MGLGKINSIIAEIGHELIHPLIEQKYSYLGMNRNTQDYLAKTFQSQIWAALGNQANATDYRNRADSTYATRLDFNRTQADDFIKAGRMPAVPQPPCK